MLDPTPDESMPAPPPREVVRIGDEMPRWAKVANVLVLTLLMAGAVGFLWVMSSLPRIEGTMPVRGLDLPATVTRDPAGVPHIRARSQRDAYFTLGWVHAQDRMWQMELQRRVGAGRLAEVVGEPGLGSDRFMRTLGLYRLAEESFAALDKPTRDALAAYAQGVNAWLDAHRHRLPPEFLLLRHRPEPWQPADSLVWGRLMALQLSNNWRDELLRARLASRLAPARVQELWPGLPDTAPATLGRGEVEGRLATLPEAALPRLASNVWAVDGSRTASGKPLLANDPHLPFQAPVLWYLAALDAPGLSLRGATVPGVPFHLVGHNGRIAWGTTTTHADTVDFFLEPAGSVATRAEVIKVKDGADVALTVRQTARGPVMSDLLGMVPAREGEVLVMRATALEADDRTAQALMKLNRAVDWRGFTTALKDFHAPVQNLAYADTAGAIGFVTAGRVPVRKGGDGTAPARPPAGDWTGWIPFERMPQTHAPRAGVVVNANNRVAAPRTPHPIATDWPEAYRAERILALLDGRKELTLDDMASMQMDHLSLAALELKEVLGTPSGLEPLAEEAARMVAAWDGTSSRSRAEPLILAAWMREAWRALFADELAKDFVAYGQIRPQVLVDTLTRNRHWCDDVTTPEAESCDSRLALALNRAVSDLAREHGAKPAQWRWGEAHQAAFDHPLLRHVPVLGTLSRITVPTDGDDFTVNRGSFGGAGFQHLHGAGLRAVFDLSNLDDSRFVIATGQSGNPLSRHYADQVEAWNDNRGLKMGRQNVDHPAVLQLEPGY